MCRPTREDAPVVTARSRMPPPGSCSGFSPIFLQDLGVAETRIPALKALEVRCLSSENIPMAPWKGQTDGRSQSWTWSGTSQSTPAV